MADPSNVIKQGDILRLEVSQKYATLHLVPNGNEGKDPNFPHNLHNVAELFLKLGMVPQAVKLKDAVDALLERYQANPDGKSGVRLGQACVCFTCGYCGIPPDYSETNKTPGPCAECQAANQLNWVRVTQPNSKECLPWIEEAAMTEVQAKELKVKKEKELAERRAAVEASVAAALANRQEDSTAASEGK